MIGKTIALDREPFQTGVMPRGFVFPQVTNMSSDVSVPLGLTRTELPAAGDNFDYGAVAPVAGALLASRLLTSFLFEVKPSDPLTFVAVALVLTAVALVASMAPALRATKVDPIIALRTE